MSCNEKRCECGRSEELVASGVVTLGDSEFTMLQGEPLRRGESQVELEIVKAVLKSYRSAPQSPEKYGDIAGRAVLAYRKLTDAEAESTD